MLYVYAILEGPGADTPQVAAARGVADGPVQLCPAGGVAAAYCTLAGGSPTPTAENLVRHEQVIETLMRDRALLPARFGTTFADEDALVAVLARNGERLSRGLEKVRGNVEMGVRVMWDAEPPAPQPPNPPPDAAPASSGRAYMLARLEEERRRRAVQERAAAVAESLHPAFVRLAIDGTRRVLPAPRVPMSGAYLVPREGVEEFQRAAHAAGVARDDVRIVCTGPWPPYHFVPELDLAGGARA